MKRIHVALVCLAAIFSIGAMTAASASAAEPEWLVLFKCFKVTPGKGRWHELFGEKCLGYLPLTGGEWEVEAGTGLAVSAGEVVDFISSSGIKRMATKVIGIERVIECLKDENTGETRDSKHILVIITYLECKVVGAGECLTIGEEAGTIITKPLYGWLWTIKETEPKEAGVFFTASEGEVVSTFECEFGELLGKKVVEVLSTPKTSYELPNGTFPNGKCLAAQIEPVHTGPTGLGELIVEELEKKQKIKLVTYDGHTFECELEIDIVGVGGPFKAWEVEVTPDDIIFEEPVEVLL
jgi:hypothetical protein